MFLCGPYSTSFTLLYLIFYLLMQMASWDDIASALEGFFPGEADQAQRGFLLARLMALGLDAASTLLNQPPGVAMAGLLGLLPAGGCSAS